MLSLVLQVVCGLVILPVAYILFGIVYRSHTRSLKFLKGPARPSLILGNDYELIHQEEVCDLESKWFKEYGTAFRASSCFAEDMLMVADPKALQYVFHTSRYKFPKSKDSQQATFLLFGRAIVWAEGEAHHRHRRALNPAFSAQQLGQFLSLFQHSTARLASKWHKELSDTKGDGKVLNLSHWLPRITLDVIGEAAFDYRFGALDSNEEANELAEHFKHMFADSRLYPQVRMMLYRAIRRSLPQPLVNILLKFPTREEKRFKAFSDTSKKVARPLFEQASRRAEQEGDTKSSKDVLSVLVRSNQTADANKSPDEDEVLSQMATIILAGHETTASTTAWMLYELTKSPKDQARIYQEIQDVRERVGADQELKADDYASMPFFNAVIKEGLRLHPIVPNLAREAGSDDVIPLDYPVMTESGEEISQIPVTKGQRIILSLAMYNRLPQVWGDDSNEWNPDRFLQSPKKMTTVGVYANLASFSAGVRACIGWRFAVQELQAILFGLLESFEFCPPEDGLDKIQRVPAGLMIPMKKGEWQKGPQMPLLVRTRQ